MPRLKGVLLDLDQTLANTEDYTFPSAICEVKEMTEYKLYWYLLPMLKVITWEEFSSLYLKARKQIREELYGTAASHSRYLFIQRTLELCGINFNPEIIQRAVKFYFDEMLKRTELYPGVLKVLKSFKYNNLKTCLVTDFTADMQIKKIKKLGITRYIDYMVTSEEAGADKPHAEQAVVALRKMNLRQDEVVVIGNNPKTDIELATRLGMKSILFDANGEYEGKKTDATFYTRDFNEINSFLKLETHKYSKKKLLVIDFIGTLTNETHLTSGVLKTFVNKDPAFISAQYALFRNSQISESKLWYSLGVGDTAKAHKTIDAAITIRKSVVELLKRLKKKYTLVLLSDFPDEWGQAIFDSRGIMNLFDKILFTSEYGITKSNRRIYEVLKNLYPTVNPENITLIDDNASTLSSGRDFLMQTILVKRTGYRKSAFVPDGLINDILELETALSKMKRINS